MNRRFAKFTEAEFEYGEIEGVHDLMLDISEVVAIKATKYGTEIITEIENFYVTDSFNDVRKILAV